MAFGYNINQRKINKRNHIIDLFRSHSILSKARAKKLSGYSMDTVISIFNSLIDDSIIVPAEGTQKAKGRKANFFTLNNDRRLYLGITFNQSGIISSLVSFSQEVLAEKRTDLAIGIDVNEFLSSLRENIDEVLSGDKTYRENLSAVGCAVPGDIDVYSGILRTYTFMPQLNGLNFRESLKTILPGLPVIIDHNIRGMTSYLIRDVELIEKYDKILFISARSGNANGFIHHGKLVVGHGEMGHVKVSDEPVECICGRKGCLDCYFSVTGLADVLPEYRAGRGKPGDINVNGALERLTTLYRKGDPDIKAELDRRIYYFTAALLDVINVTAPDMVILSGELFSVYGDPVPIIKGTIEAHYRNSGYVTHYQNTVITYRELDTSIASLGICFEMIKNDWGYYREDKKK